MSNVITRQRYGLGWIRDIPKPLQDYRFSAMLDTATTLPHEIDLEPASPPILNQGRTNSCVAHGSASLFRYTLKRQGLPDFAPSRSFIYWFTRHVPRLGWETVDEGAMPRDAMQTMISNGVVSEDDWPFDPDLINVRPPQELLTKAKSHRIIEGRYVRMKADDDLYHLKYSLAQRLPFLIGIDVYSSFFDTGSDGMVPMPKTSETYEGGHLMWCNGFFDSIRRVKCPNSWGTGEGDRGHFYLPYEYVANRGLASDFWRIEAIT